MTTRYEQYRNQCSLEGRMIPVAEYLASLPSSERAELESERHACETADGAAMLLADRTQHVAQNGD